MAEMTKAYGLFSEKSEFGMTHSRDITVSGINDCANTYIAPYSKITKVIVHAEAYQTIALGSTKSDMLIYFRKDSSSTASLYLLDDHENVPKGKWVSFDIDATSYFVTNGSNLGHVNVSGMGLLTFFHQASVARTLKTNNCYVRWYWTTPTYVLSLSASTGGTVSGGGTYEVGSTATIKATPNTGYKFVKWSDGNTNAERQITITSSEISANVTNRSYTAYFEIDKTYVTYDSIFDFQRWANTNLKSWSLMNVSNVTNTGFTGQALVDDAYTEECRPLIPVTKGKTYTFECNTSGGGFEFFIFNCNSSGGWADFTYGNTNKFNFTPSMDYISIRCDIVGTGTVVNFDNFRIYPADCPYMGSTVSAVERTDINAWSMPTPTRDGYRFLGWFTQPNGGGVKYTPSSAFPSGGADLVLYSHWEIAKINKIYVGTSQPKAIYIGTQEVKEVYIGTTKVYG